MKKPVFLIILICCAANLFAQPKAPATNARAAGILAKKHLTIDILEGQVNDISLAEIRVFARREIASWLWSAGKDDTGRAEQIAVRAIDDLLQNEAEISQYTFIAFKTQLFTLLDRNAKSTAKRLREKYQVTLEDTADLFWLKDRESEKTAVDLAIRSLTNPGETDNKLWDLVSQLQQRRSPERFRLLEAIMRAEESGQIALQSFTLNVLSLFYLDPEVSLSLKKRYLSIVLERSRKAAQPGGGDAEEFFHLLSRMMPEISLTTPELLADAGIIQAVLRAKVSQASREIQERNERIDNSPDKLSAMITEAEKAGNNGEKYDLYKDAVYLAIKLKKFAYAVDIVQKMAEIELKSSVTMENSRKIWREQIFGEIAGKAFESADPDGADQAIKQMTDPVVKAEALRKKADYHIELGDQILARTALDESIRFAAKIERGSAGVACLVRLLPTAQKIAPGLVFELNELLARSINSIPSLGTEDKPGTENYKNYVTSLMIINGNLLPAYSSLIKVNKTGAADLVNRINKKEIKIIADYVVLTDPYRSIPDQKKSREKAATNSGNEKARSK
jgi:hypothetical protein